MSESEYKTTEAQATAALTVRVALIKQGFVIESETAPGERRNEAGMVVLDTPYYSIVASGKDAQGRAVRVAVDIAADGKTGRPRYIN